MVSTENIQTEIKKLLKPVPAMPSSATKWLSTNFWILTAVGLVLMVMSVFAIVGSVITAYTVTTSFMGYYYGYHPSIWWLIQSLTSVAGLIISIIFMSISIKPLKAFEKKGWEMMFLAVLVSAAFIVVSSVLSFDVSMIFGSLISAAISIAIGSYILLAIKPNFNK